MQRLQPDHSISSNTRTGYARIRYCNGLVEVVFLYKETIVERLKNEIPRDSRDYDPVQKCWRVALCWAPVAIGILRDAFGDRLQIVEDRWAA